MLLHLIFSIRLILTSKGHAAFYNNRNAQVNRSTWRCNIICYPRLRKANKPSVCARGKQVCLCYKLSFPTLFSADCIRPRGTTAHLKLKRIEWTRSVLSSPTCALTKFYYSLQSGVLTKINGNLDR